MFLDHAQLDAHPVEPCVQVISPSQKVVPTLHRTNTIDEYPCSQWDSNRQSQQIERPQTYAFDRTATRIVYHVYFAG
jgi:hypothetical protein